MYRKIKDLETNFDKVIFKLNEFEELDNLVKAQNQISKNRSNLQKAFGQNKTGVDVVVALNRKEMKNSIELFQRTIRRLSILRTFAKKIQIEFDIENMDISVFHYQGEILKKGGEVNYYEITE